MCELFEGISLKPLKNMSSGVGGYWHKAAGEGAGIENKVVYSH